MQPVNVPTPLKVMPIFGTRPEAVKMAPIIHQLRQRPQQFEVVVTVTAQHREMLDQFLRVFAITPQHDLNIMETAQTLEDITARVLYRLAPVLEQEKPDVILVQGDTTTVFAASLAAFYRYGAMGRPIVVGHVEAGLRTDNKFDPYPEEMNRRLTTALTDLHFAPTPRAKENLLRENVPTERIYVTGNTVIDALLSIAQEDAKRKTPKPEGRLLLVTAHRRENWGEPMANICYALRALVEKFDDVRLIFAVHRNPVVRNVVFPILQGHERIELREPPDYLEFVSLMQAAHLILTDSGGVQEEAPALGKPVLVLRRTTERPEGIAAGTAKLVGTNTD
ncbi:MAG: UDP-N-acetylglucosamine 2-epimerase (non-hydrolyzing), partial [Abditibacteriales bacterium]|nr:UDP-N-acetylglucosamine 2-epimerase (non-hydrolyzing) [Abditibacteriales bacterium]